MNAFETLVVAMRGLRTNRMRTSLTMLGILIGVAAVIVLVAVGNGSSQAVQDRITSLGSNTLTISSQSGNRSAGGAISGGTSSRSATLDEDDLDALRDTTDNPDIKAIAPVVSTSSVSASRDGATYSPKTFVGTSGEYASIRDYELFSGAFFTDDDVENHSKVVVLGQTVVTNLFGNTDPIGEKVKLGATQFTVIGVLKAEGSNGSQDQDDIAFAPYTTVQDTLSGRTSGFSQILVQAESSKVMDQAAAEIDSTLRTSHKLSAGDTADFQVLNQATLLETSEETNSIFTVLLGAVAGVSLLVGGIGVMNIMLVTVSERTREIGIRKAIGAKRGDIVGQFLTEAVLLSVLGGLAGVVAGLVISRFEIAGVQPVVAPYSVALAFGVAVVVGLFFGLYPANRAAALRPIDALRHE